MMPYCKYALLALALLYCICGQGAVISVSRNLRQAIAAAHHGDTLIVKAGVYREHDIIISKRLTIKGERYPVIDGEGKHELFIIHADSVVISGLQIQNTGRSSMRDIAGIKMLDVSYAMVSGNRLINNTYGVYMQNATHCTIKDNLIQSNSVSELNSGNGVHGWKSSHLAISGNRISGHRDGIYFEFVTDSRITGNTSCNNLRYGLHFMFSHNDAYTNNTFRDNGAGVAVMYSKGVTMLHNTFVHNWGDAAYGILLKEIADSRIENNRFLKNTVGIYMEGTSRIVTVHNSFENNGWAMRIQANCNGNKFIENDFSGNSFDVATNGSLSLNEFRRNYWDKYDGYDLDKNKIGDVPYYPVSLYSVITEKIPSAMILYRSFLTDVIDKAEKVMPGMTPDALRDDEPVMKKWKL